MRDAATAEAATLPDPALPAPPWAARIPRWGWILAYVAADRALWVLGHLLTERPGGFAVVWPPAGLTLFALLVTRRRTWPALLGLSFAVSTAGSVWYGRPPLTAASYAAANLVQALASWWVVVRLGGRPTLRTLRGALVLMLAPAAALAAVSMIAHLLLSAGAVAPFTEVRFWTFWAGASLGVLFVTTLLVEWVTPGRPLLDSREAKLSAAGIAIAFVVAFVAMRIRGAVVDEVVLSPPLLWAALRFGPRGATSALAVAVLGLFANVGPGAGHLGPVAHPHTAEESAIALQLFLALGSAPILAAAAVGAERRQAAERRAVLERAFDQTLDPAGVFEEDGTVVWANQAMARQLGISRAALVGRRVWELVAPTSPEIWRERWQRVAASRAAVVEEARPGPDGRVVPWEISAAVVDVGGRELMISVLRDLSDRRRAEEASRLAALGTLAAGVAHEINNPLSYVVANVSHVRERLGALGERLGDLRAEVVEPLVDAEDGARRVHDIVQQLRAFAREDQPAGPVDVARALRAALAMTQNEIRRRARTRVDVADVSPVAGSENRLVQVFVNLLLNAAQGIREGSAPGHEVSATLRARGDEVVAEIADTGVGMTAETRARAFDPFFTTKGPGAGAGLGLAISHSIVTGMGGKIEVESQPGAGSTFRVVLPAARGVRAPAPAAAPAPSAPPGRRRMLVVDDEPLVSRVVARILAAEGEVVVVDRATDALARLRGGERFDAIVCDLMMPDLSGMELHGALRQLDPEIADRMVFVTGGAFTDAAREFLASVPNARLEKPLDVAALREAVRRV